MATLDRCRGKSGPARLRICATVGLVQRRGPARSPRAIARAALVGSRAGTEVPPLQCRSGGAPVEVGAGACDAMDDRGRHSIGKGRVRSRRVRDAWLDWLAPSHDALTPGAGVLGSSA